MNILIKFFKTVINAPYFIAWIILFFVCNGKKMKKDLDENKDLNVTKGKAKDFFYDNLEKMEAYKPHIICLFWLIILIIIYK
jgi:hypothetical protein